MEFTPLDLLRMQRNNAPRWLITFADMMALLFALFVLILSFSEVDSDSFKKNAGPMARAFNQPEPTSILRDKTGIAPGASINLSRDDSDPDYIRQVNRTRLMAHLKEAMSDEIAREMVELIVKNDVIIVRFPGSSTFASGSSDLQTRILPTLDRIADVIARTKGKVFVTGHTDDTPISTQRYRSNWDLSSARAASVVHHILKHQTIDRNRVQAIGFAETRPLTKNDTAENRSLNRRVEISIEISSLRE